MPTPREISYRYSCETDTVAELLRNAEYLRTRCESFGDRNVDVRVTPQDDGVRVVVERDQVAELPSFAKRLFKSENRIVDDTVWRRVGDRWVAEYTVDIKGAPGKVAGRSELIPDGDGCKYVTRFEVTANVPLLGSKLEEYVADRIASTMQSGVHTNAERLARA
jgi:hypothetical protein